MADCNFEGNSKGIYFKYDSYDFEAARCNFENNGIGVDAYNISLFSGCRFDSCHFIGNDQAINGGFILTNSYIANGIDGMDGGVMFSGYENHISNCIIENMSGVVFSGAGAAQDVSNCIIRNNTGAVALIIAKSITIMEVYQWGVLIQDYIYQTAYTLIIINLLAFKPSNMVLSAFPIALFAIIIVWGFKQVPLTAAAFQYLDQSSRLMIAAVLNMPAAIQ
jgi:hypothetical protein